MSSSGVLPDRGPPGPHLRRRDDDMSGPGGPRSGKTLSDDMIRVPGGTFRMGSDRHYPDEAPSHSVTVDGFWIDATPVTNAQFRAFVAATNYVTWAEIAPDPKDYPGA